MVRHGAWTWSGAVAVALDTSFESSSHRKVAATFFGAALCGPPAQMSLASPPPPPGRRVRRRARPGRASLAWARHPSSTSTTAASRGWRRGRARHALPAPALCHKRRADAHPALHQPGQERGAAGRATAQADAAALPAAPRGACLHARRRAPRPRDRIGSRGHPCAARTPREAEAASGPGRARLVSRCM